MNKSIYDNPLKATTIDMEIRMLEKAKERQKIEIQTLIQHQINRQQRKKMFEDKRSPSKYKITERKVGGIALFFNNL